MRLFNACHIVLFCAIGILISSCANLTTNDYDISDIDTTNYSQLVALRQPLSGIPRKKGLNAIRLQGLKEVAMSLGAQAALAKRGQEIDSILEKNHAPLDQVFNFEVLMLDNQVLPPVLVEGRRALDKSDDSTIRLSDKTYRIIQQARFATTLPNWRNYLLLSYQKPEVPDYTLLPRVDHDDEIATWSAGLNEGWQQGTRQATDIFNENLSRLKRDYEGMLLYHKLINENMITPPFVAKTELGVTGGGDELTINDRFKRITNMPSLNASSEDWKPVIASPVVSVGKMKEKQNAMRPMRMIPKMTPEDTGITEIIYEEVGTEEGYG